MSSRAPFVLHRTCGWLTIAIVAASAWATAGVAHAQSDLASFEIVAAFDNMMHSPYGGMVEGPDGTLYGATHYGGVAMCGTVFKVPTAGEAVLLHTFGGVHAGADGCNPAGNLVFGPDGDLYGTTYLGGNRDDYSWNGTGTIFRISLPAEEYSVVHRFALPSPSAPSLYPEGRWIFGGLTRGIDNALYGITMDGGYSSIGNPSGCSSGGGGVFFRYAPNTGMLTPLYALRPLQDGCNSQGGLTLGADGHFYGTALRGGASWDWPGGTVFRISHNGEFTKLFTFPYDTSCTDLNLCRPFGGDPFGAPVRDAAGNLYGVTLNYGPAGDGHPAGNVWKLSTAGVMTLLKTFRGDPTRHDGFPQGASPSGGLTLGWDGYLYGTTVASTPTAFRLSTLGEFALLHGPTENFYPLLLNHLLERRPGEFIGTTTNYVYRLTMVTSETPIATTTSLVAPASIAYGAQFSASATITVPHGHVCPGGTVTFSDAGVILGEIFVYADAAGSTTCRGSFEPVAPLGVGTHHIAAQYAGVDRYQPSTSAPTAVVVSRAPTVTTLISTPNPSARKQTITLTTNVTAPFSPVAVALGEVPTGRVNVMQGKKKIGTIVLVNGSGTLQLSLSGPGDYVFTAVYDGDQNFAGGTSAPLTHAVQR